MKLYVQHVLQLFSMAFVAAFVAISINAKDKKDDYASSQKLSKDHTKSFEIGVRHNKDP